MSNIQLEANSVKFHAKLSATYVSATYTFRGKKFQWVVPIVDKYTGVNIDPLSEDSILSYLLELKPFLDPASWDSFRKGEIHHWSSKNSDVTKPIFEKLLDNFDWLPYSKLSTSSNTARRVQSLREEGYSIAARQNGRVLEIQLLPIPRKQGFKYETWTPGLRKRILRVLGTKDAFEGRVVPQSHLLPDHKFPEIRWGSRAARENLEVLSDEQILSDFQLINNQRNQQKREACRGCFQTGLRPTVLGIRYYYEGSEKWDPEIPVSGSEAETGCIGCPWYDLDAWRKSLNSRLKSKD